MVTWQLGRAAIVDVQSGALALLAGVALVTLRINSAWLILAGATAGVVMSLGS